MKKILILGGTKFIGRALTERLRSLPGYDITLFNRGKSNTDLFSDLKQIHGDREADDIEKISCQQWDCIIDFSGYYPITFEKLLNALKGKVNRYIFISTGSVYNLAELAGKLLTEEMETLPCSEAQKTSKLPDAYGEKKAEMERILLSHYWLDKIIFRPSFIYGKYDWTERFYYWLYRANFAHKILMPDGGKPFNFSLTNSDDLTEGLLQAISIEKHSTVYNTISQPQVTLRDIVLIAAKSLNKKIEFVDVPAAKLESLGLQAGQFPLFVPFNFLMNDALWERDFLFKRSDISSTLSEMISYKAAQGFPKPNVGLDFEKEKEVIAGLMGQALT